MFRHSPTGTGSLCDSTRRTTFLYEHVNWYQTTIRLSPNSGSWKLYKAVVDASPSCLLNDSMVVSRYSLKILSRSHEVGGALQSFKRVSATKAIPSGGGTGRDHEVRGRLCLSTPPLTQQSLLVVERRIPIQSVAAPSRDRRAATTCQLSIHM